MIRGIGAPAPSNTDPASPPSPLTTTNQPSLSERIAELERRHRNAPRPSDAASPKGEAKPKRDQSADHRRGRVSPRGGTPRRAEHRRVPRCGRCIPAMDRAPAGRARGGSTHRSRLGSRGQTTTAIACTRCSTAGRLRAVSGLAGLEHGQGESGHSRFFAMLHAGKISRQQTLCRRRSWRSIGGRNEHSQGNGRRCY